MLRVEQVSKRFFTDDGPVDALRNVDLKVDSGTFTAVLGASGSGKTTLLRIIAGFERPDAGLVELEGVTLAEVSKCLPPERRNVGIVPQDGALFPHLNVHDNVAYGLNAGSRAAWFRAVRRPSGRAGSGERVEELLDLVGLAGYGSRRPNELSGGQQQRVALARALAPRPSLLLMDEPFSALDAGLRVSIREEVRELLRLLGTTVVLVTHDQNEALSMADQVVIMRDGQVVQAGSPNGVYTNPADLETAAFLGAAVVLPGKVLVANGQGTSTEVETALGVVSVGWDSPRMTDDGDRGRRVDGGVTVVVRPEQLELTAPGATDRGASGTVGSVSFYGHDGTARVLLDDGTTEVVVRVLGLGLPDQGDRVMVSLVEGARAQIL